MPVHEQQLLSKQLPAGQLASEVVFDHLLDAAPLWRLVHEVHLLQVLSQLRLALYIQQSGSSVAL